MGTDDGARGEASGLLGALCGSAGRGARAGPRQHLLLRRGRQWAQPLAFLAAGVLIGFFSAGVLHLPPHRTSHGEGPGGSLLSRWRDLGVPPAGGSGSGSGDEQQGAAGGQAKCPPCPACPMRKAEPPAAEKAGSAQGGPSAEVLKGEWGLDAYGTVDAGQAFDAFWPFVPGNIRESLYPRATVLSTRNARMAVHGADPGHGPLDIEMGDLESCKEVTALMLGGSRCYVAVNAKLPYPAFLAHRYKHDPESPTGWTLVPRIEKEGSSPPLLVNRRKHETFLLALFQHYDDVLKEAEALLKKATAGHGGEKKVMAMALNEGDTDMLVNFVCSARAANIALDRVVVFAADQATVEVAEGLGLLAFTHPAFGELPSEHAKHYGDAGFLAIMWLKIVAIWLPVRLGYDVFFQDADLVWFKDPWEAFDDPHVDGYFMDDGARSERFAPLWANSGFYYLRANPMVTHFVQSVLFSYDMIVQYASHQTLFIQALHEHIARNGLRVRILDYTKFAGGQVFHHRKELMEQIKRREYLPYTFHMCWTQTKHDKLKNMQDATLWFLSNACNGSAAAIDTLKGKKLSIDTCCVDPLHGAGASASASAAERKT